MTETNPTAAPAEMVQSGASDAAASPVNPDTANAEAGSATSADPATATTGEGDGQSPNSGEPAADNAAHDDARRTNKVPARERISQLTRTVRQHEQTIARLQAEHQDVTRNAQPVGDPLDYASDGEYQRALAQSVANETEARAIERTARNVVADRQAAVVDVWNERCDDYRAIAPDFDAVVFNDALNVPRGVTELVLAVENGPAVAYFLGKNPAEINRIARLSEREAAIAIGALSNRVAAPNPKRQTNAPAPVRTVNGSGNTTTVDPGNLNNRDYREWRAKQSSARS